MKEQSEPINVFGGNGFVGKYFCAYNKNVISQERNNLSPKSKDILYFISTTDNYSVYNNPHLDIETNLTLLIRVLENAKAKYSKDFTFTFVSSWFVYGETDLIANENSPCRPTGFYSSTKLCAEQLLRSYCETFGIPYQILRYANVLGAGDGKISLQKNAFQYLLREIVRGRDVRIYSEPSFRDFIDVRDVVYATNLCMNVGKKNEVYNIGNGISNNVKKLLYYVRERSGSDSVITEMDVPNFHKIVQVKDFRMDTGKLTSLGYIPKYTIWKTIDDLIVYYRNGNEV